MDLINGLAELLSGDWQGQRLLRMDFPRGDGPPARMLVNSLDADEALSRDFAYVVEVLSDDAAIPIPDVMGRMVTISLVRDDGSLRYFNGYVTKFGFIRTDGGFARYRMVLSPWLAFLRLRQNCKLFQNMSLTGILEKTFEDYVQRDYQYRLLSELPEITLAIQYNESDHNHIHRRLEDAGLFYWYEHRYDGHTLWISDDSTVAQPLDGDAATIVYRAESGSIEDDGISHWMPSQMACPVESTVSSYDFKIAHPARANRSAALMQGTIPALETYESTGAYGFRDSAAGDNLASRRMDQLTRDGITVSSRGNHRSIQPGRCFSLCGHFGAEGESQYLIVSARHTATNNYQADHSGRSEYSNQMQCVRKASRWRAPRGFQSDDTRIYGLQTATVVGPEGEEIYTDEFGRVRVQFHWDRLGKFDPASSPWIRVMTGWAGARFGQICLPRVGQEVVIQFLEGNCDRPLIVGSLYNATHMPPWDLPGNRTQSGILTRSTIGGEKDNANALRFEDKKGVEELWIHAERDQRIEVENDESHWVGHDRRKNVDHDEVSHIKNDRTETVDNNEKITIHNCRSERVDNNESIAIGGNRDETVGKNETVLIHGLRQERVMLAKEESIGLGKALTVGGGYAISVGAAMNTLVAGTQATEVAADKSVQIGQSYTIKVADAFEITVGKAKLVLKSDGSISLVGSEILIEGSGPVRINGNDIDLN